MAGADDGRHPPLLWSVRGLDQLQKTQLALLEQFIAVCRELGLTWYLVRGSALGAVKYGGFIPWDDDVDVALPRRDYDIFTARAQELLPAHIFVQTHVTDPAFPKLFCKLRDSNTTFVETYYRKLPIHHGVFIDVLPLDGYPEQGGRRFERRLRWYLRRTSCALELPRRGKSALLCAALRVFGCHNRTAAALKGLDRLLRRCPAEESSLWCSCGNFRGKLIPEGREVYGDGVEMTFEGLPVRVPTGYDAYLRGLYGDYHADPPPEEQAGHHYYAALDLNTPYTEFGGEAK